MKVQGIQLVKRAPKDGVSVVRIDNYYLCEATGTVPSADDSRWTLVADGGTIPVPTAAAPYLWHKSVTVMSDGSMLAPVIDFCGSLGKNGFDYDLVPSASTIVKKEDGTLSPSRVSCSLIRREADGTATSLTTVPSGYSILVQKDSAYSQYTLGTDVSVEDCSVITFILYYMGIRIEVHDIHVISEGSQGMSGRGIQSQDYRFRAMAENNAPATPTSDTEWNLWYALANAGYSAEKPYLFRCIKTVYVDGTGVTTTEYTVDGPTVWGNDAVTYEIQPDNGSMIDGNSYSLLFYIYKIVGSERTLLSLADINANGMQCIETGGTMLYSSQLKKFLFAVTKAVFGQEYTFGLKSSSGEVLCSYTWTVQKQGDKGDKGDDGKSTLYIDCVPDSFTYPADNDGYCTQDVTNIATLRLMYGTTQVTDYSVEVRTTDDRNWYTEDTYAQQGGDVFVANITRDGNDAVISINVGESSYADNNAWVQVRLTTTIDGKEVSTVKQINCYANKEGTRGYDGVIIRRREWESGKEYRNDTDHESAAADGNYYLDEVCVSDYNDGEGKSYICKQTHTSSASNKPPQNGTSNYWTTMNNVAPIMTPFADITRAVIDYLQAKQITIEQNGTAYGAFGGGDYPLWFGGSNASDAAFKVSKDGILSAMGAILQGTLTEETLQINGNSYQNLPIVVEKMRSITINNPYLNMVVLPTYYGFKDKSYAATNGPGEENASKCLSVPAYTQGGTHLTINSAPIENYAGWGALNENLWTSEAKYIPGLLDHCVLICADPQTLCCYVNAGNANLNLPSHMWNGSVLSNGYYVSSTGYAGYAHGRFSYKGAIGRFLILLPGQHVHLISAVETFTNSRGNEEKCLVWHIENAADFSPVSMRMYWNDSQSTTQYEDFPSSTSSLSMVDMGVDYVQDMLFAPPILDVKKLGTGYDGEVKLTVTLGGIDANNPVPHLWRTN